MTQNTREFNTQLSDYAILPVALQDQANDQSVKHADHWCTNNLTELPIGSGLLAV